MATDPEATDTWTHQLAEQQNQRIDQLVVDANKLNQRVDSIYLILILSLIAIALATSLVALLSRRRSK